MNYWFKPKKYGYGFVPTDFFGWVMTIFLLMLVLASGYINDLFSNDMDHKEAIRFLLDMFILCGVFCYFAEKKMDGTLKWRWGK